MPRDKTDPERNRTLRINDWKRIQEQLQLRI